MSKAAKIVFIWRKSVYDNGFRCPACGAALFDMATKTPTDDSVMADITQETGGGV